MLPNADPGIVVTQSGHSVSYNGDIYPAQGSETIPESTTGAGPTVINYYFPVEIVVVGDVSEETHQVIQARVWENLGDALDRLG